MRLRRTPEINARYWTAILLASMCGTNLGDVFPDVLKLGIVPTLAILAAAFAAIVAADRVARRGSEASYWSAILVVRAAATQIADFFVFKMHLGFVGVGLVLAAVLAGFVAVRRRSTTSGLPASDGHYWVTMLTAGSLGTVIGDGMGHILRPSQVGVPVSAALATFALVGVIGARARPGWRFAAGYWTCIVVVRWWGTNLGDILAFSTSLALSLGLTGSAMTAVLLAWWKRGDDAVGPAA